MQQPPDFVSYPTPSPTSRLGINVRYYHIQSEMGQEVYWDLGKDGEEMVESCYHPNPALSPDAFGSLTRTGIQFGLQHGVEFFPLLLIYALASGNTALYEKVVDQHKKVLSQIGMSLGAQPPEPPTSSKWKVW